MDRDKIIEMAAVYAMKTYQTDSSLGIHSKKTDATGFMWDEGELQVIAFRGSDNWKDWLLNISAVPIPWRKTMTHMGFYIHFSSIQKEILERVQHTRPVLIVGHSLGGANAELLAYRLRQHYNCHMVTFGKPNVFARIGAPKFNLSGQKISVVHGSDIVARIPRFFYRPSRQDLLYLGNDGVDKWNPTKKERRRDWALGDSVGDHMMPDYLERVANYLTNQRAKH